MSLAGVRRAFKKAARRAVASSRHLRRSRRGVIRAVTYHRFTREGASDPFCVDAGTFETQMRWLAERGLAISHDDVLAFIAGQRDLRPGAVFVTIDDGYSSVAAVALPILREYAIPAALYVSTDLIGNDAASRANPERYLSWREVERLHEHGIMIGSHSHTHRSMGQLPLEEVHEELRRSRDVLAERLGAAPVSFAYPFGTPAHYSPATHDAVLAAGYRSGFVSTHGSIGRGAHPAHLSRVKVEGGEPLSMFHAICSGGMDGWWIIDHLVCALRGQRRRN